MVETVRNTSSYSVRQICQTLGFNRSLVYSHSKSDPSQRELREKIEALCLEYPKYGYRRIKALLLRQGYTVGTRRVARLMKEANLSVAVKRACQTTHSMERRQPWQNRLKTLDICRCDQVWVGDITYVRLKGRFIYVALLMDVFTRMIKRVAAESALDANSDLETLRASVSRERSGDTSLRSSIQYLSSAYLSTLRRHGIEISVARRGCPWENGYAERLIRTLKEEEVHLNAYHDIHEARERIGQFITHVYNQKRPHSALGYLTPMEFQRETLS